MARVEAGQAEAGQVGGARIPRSSHTEHKRHCHSTSTAM